MASTIVTAAAVALRPLQAVNALKDKQINILQVAGIYDPDADVVEAFSAFEPHVLELTTGEFTDAFDPATFDDRAAADDPSTSQALTDDPAGIGRKADYVTVYLLRDGAAVEARIRASVGPAAGEQLRAGVG